MYYLELIQKFWNYNREKSIGSSAISMYLYLLKIGYDNDRYDLKVSDVDLEKVLGMTNKTIKSTKEKLGNLGLIQFQTKNGLPCSYRLLLDYPVQISTSKRIEKKEIKEEQYVVRSEESSDGLSNKVSENLEGDAEIKLSQTKMSSQTSQTSIDNDKIIPNWLEFMQFAKALESYEVELDLEIETKYEDWKNNGWRNGSDRPITNWMSSLKSALPFMKSTINPDTLSLKSIPNIKPPKPKNGDAR